LKPRFFIREIPVFRDTHMQQMIGNTTTSLKQFSIHVHGDISMKNL